MQKIYLLLRKNKQSGPYSLKELLDLQLQPMDLIWEEGKSKSWVYPSELPALKGHMKGTEKPEDAVYPSEQNSLVLPKISNNKGGKKEEAIHVEVYVKLPERYKAGVAIPEKSKPKEADPPQEQHQSEPQGTEDSKDEGYEILSKKYVRDLDDIKEEYSKWISRQKSNVLQPVKKKFIRIWAVCIVLLVAAFITDRWKSFKTDGKIDLKEDSVQVDAVKTSPTAAKTAKKKKAEVSKSESAKSKKDKAEVGAAASEKKQEPGKGEKVVKPAADVKSDKEKSSLNADEVFQNLNIRYSYDTTNHEGLKGLHFTIHNLNDFTLNAVAVNLFYKNAEGGLLNKETIYFNNVLAGSMSAATASPPDGSKTVTYKPGLVSVDGKIYYSSDQ